MPASAPVGSSATMAPISEMVMATLRLANRIRHRGRPAQFPEHLARRCRPGPHQFELQRIGRGKALHHADRDRKEAEIGRDDRFRQQPVQPERSKHHDEDRGEREDRHHLRADDPWEQASFQHPAMHDQQCQQRRRTMRQARSRAASPTASPASDRPGCAAQAADSRTRNRRKSTRSGAAPAAVAAPRSIVPDRTSVTV